MTTGTKARSDTTSDNFSMVQTLMQRFAQRTGLTTDVPPKRYLWTDAFAVCNFLELHRQSGNPDDLNLALRLVDQVHHVLGRFAENDARNGWLSGLSDTEGEAHPTRAGLRIGKSLPERRLEDAFDEQLEWEREGQYFHYLTRWMHALDAVARATGEARYNRWALELAKAAFQGFVFTDPATGRQRMVWKMSVDLSRPQVPSMGHHDPLDGLLTFMSLQNSAGHFGTLSADLDLCGEIAAFHRLCRGMDWATQDSLGAGGLLTDVCRVSQLLAHTSDRQSCKAAPGRESEQESVQAPSNESNTRPLLLELLQGLLRDAETSLEMLTRQDSFKAPPHYRLAFRELGLSIGLHGLDLAETVLTRPTSVEWVPAESEQAFERLRGELNALKRYRPLADAIEAFWLKPESQHSPTWGDHLDINSVMLATSLAPEGYLDIQRRVPSH